MQLKLIIAVCFLAFGIKGWGQSEVPIPTQAQLNWQNAELVAVFHYDLHVFDGEKYNQKKKQDYTHYRLQHFQS